KLVLLGIGAVDIFDFDNIERHNLTRGVLFRETDVGSPKAVRAAERAQELDPSVEIRAFCGDFWKTLKISQVKSYKCIICCVDNFEARIRLNQICTLTRVNLVNTGIDSRYASAEFYPFEDRYDTACYECNLPLTAYQRIAERYSCGWLRRVAYAERKVPTTVV